MPDKSVGVVMPVRINFRGAVQALESVRTKYSWTPYISPQWRKNKALASRWNEGIKAVYAAGHSHCLVVNDDILFAPYTIDALIETLDELDDDVLILSAANVRSHKIVEPADIFNFPQPEPALAESPDFSCFLIRKEAMDAIGDFDENFYPAYHEDNDYVYRMKLKGFKALSQQSAAYYHFGSVSHRMMVRKSHEPIKQFEAGRKYYLQKWGGLPGDEKFRLAFENAD